MSHFVLDCLKNYIKSQAKDSEGNPAWLTSKKNGAIVLSRQFVKDGSVQMLKVTAL